MVILLQPGGNPARFPDRSTSVHTCIQDAALRLLSCMGHVNHLCSICFERTYLCLLGLTCALLVSAGADESDVVGTWALRGCKLLNPVRQNAMMNLI